MTIEALQYARKMNDYINDKMRQLGIVKDASGLYLINDKRYHIIFTVDDLVFEAIEVIDDSMGDIDWSDTTYTDSNLLVLLENLGLYIYDK